MKLQRPFNQKLSRRFKNLSKERREELWRSSHLLSIHEQPWREEEEEEGFVFAVHVACWTVMCRSFVQEHLVRVRSPIWRQQQSFKRSAFMFVNLEVGYLVVEYIHYKKGGHAAKTSAGSNKHRKFIHCMRMWLWNGHWCMCGSRTAAERNRFIAYGNWASPSWYNYRLLFCKTRQSSDLTARMKASAEAALPFSLCKYEGIQFNCISWRELETFLLIVIFLHLFCCQVSTANIASMTNCFHVIASRQRFCYDGHNLSGLMYVRTVYYISEWRASPSLNCRMSSWRTKPAA